jgi:Reverse transcriptase (RNA-dependent DNA polymerase)
MSEFNFPTKIIRLTAALLNTVLCFVKIQNSCSEYFETRQGLRQGDVLSTLVFNVVLESFVQRAKLLTNGTIFNKQTHKLGYADDIGMIGRSQAAVREAFIWLERDANKVGLKINESKTKYMIAAGNERMIRQRICVFGIPGDTEQRCESGDTEENPDCIYASSAQIIAVGAKAPDKQVLFSLPQK